MRLPRLPVTLLVLLVLFPFGPLPAQDPAAERDSLLILAHTAGTDSLRAEALNRLANSYLHEAPGQMLTYAQKALRIAREIEDPILTGRSALKTGLAHFFLGHTDSAFAFLEVALVAFDRGKDLSGRIEVLTNLANFHYGMGDYVKAERTALEVYQALETAEPTPKFLAYRIAPLIITGNIHSLSGRYQEAVESYREALRLCYWLKNQGPKIPLIVNNIASVFSNYLGQPDSALYYLEEAVSEPSLDRNLQARIIISMNIGDLWLHDLGNRQTAQDWYRSAYLLGRESGIVLQESNVLLRLAEIELARGEVSRGDSLIEAAWESARERRDANSLRKALDMRVQRDSLRGDLAGALRHLREGQALQDSLLGVEKQMEVRALQQQIALNRKDHEIQVIGNAREYERRRNRWMMLAVVALVLSGGGWGIYRYLLVRKNRKLAEAEAALRAVRVEMLEADLRGKEKEEELLRQELEFKSQRLVDFATYLSVKKQLVHELTGHIREHAVGPARDSLQELLRRIQPHLQLDKDQQDLELYMEKAHQRFLLALERRYPDLTKGEKKLAGLIRTGLSSKETAALLGIHPKSVEMRRYRLRKKLGLGSDDDLKAFLDEIGSA